MAAQTVAEFWALVKRDAAVQEQVVHAAKQAQPLDALVQVAVDAGFNLAASELYRSLAGELSDRELDMVSGGLSTAPDMGAMIETRVIQLRAPVEWIA